jgi:hypothetical protein
MRHTCLSPMADFGAALTPELREQEDKLRAQMDSQQR